MNAGDILNFEYTGAPVSQVLPPGKFKLEVWGAQGGYRSSSSYGGLGGFSTGELTLNEETTVIVRVGGSGNTGGTAGGFNGGGKRSTYNGGGGASDIRIGTDDLLARVMVAGGGGSDGASNKIGLYGGGTTGGSATQSYGSGGEGGTQTAGGTGGSGNAGTFGQGGEGKHANSGHAGAGGGGWYGGGGSYPDGSGDDDRGGGGGSGFVWTGSNAPSGYLLGSEYYLANASTAAGNTAFTAPGGSNETGHPGNGYARITVLELFPQGPDTPGNFRQTVQDYFAIGLAWNAVECTGYRLYRNGELLSTLTATTYTDGTVQPNGSYTYTLIAYNDEGDSNPAMVVAETSKGFAVRTIEITEAKFTVNPCETQQVTVLSLTAIEAIKVLQPEDIYSDEIYSNEV